MFAINGHTPFEYAAIHIHTEITPPSPKIDWLEIPLRDGAINASAILSDRVFYKTGTVLLGIEVMAMRSEWPWIRSKIMEDLHGMDVQLSIDDSEYYWTGVADVGQLEDHGSTAYIQITVTVQPFQRKSDWKDLGDVAVSTTATKTVKINSMRAYFEFTTSAANMTLTYGGVTYTLPIGKSTGYGFYLAEGTHTLTFGGSGTIGVRYQEAKL
jgi:hypothetical protein